MLNVIDIFSKYTWSIPLKDKTGNSVLDGFKHIVKESERIPKHIWVDEGKEFYNKLMNEWLKENNIIRYSTHGEHKSVVVERFNRTLKKSCDKSLLLKILEIGLTCLISCYIHIITTEFILLLV